MVSPANILLPLIASSQPKDPRGVKLQNGLSGRFNEISWVDKVLQISCPHIFSRSVTKRLLSRVTDPLLERVSEIW